MNRIPTLTSLVFLSLIALAGCTGDVTEPELPQLDSPAMSGIGWTGGGGRTDTASTTTSEAGAASSGIGVFGGGG
jgi:hypothetical protein